MLAEEEVLEDLRPPEGVLAEDLPCAEVDLAVVGRVLDEGPELVRVLLEVGDARHERELAHVREVQVERRAAIACRRGDAADGDALDALLVDDFLRGLDEGRDDGLPFLFGVLGSAHDVLLPITER